MDDLFDTIITTSAQTAMTMLNDRDAGHSMTMRLWGRREATLTQGPRAQVGCQWMVTTLDVLNDRAEVLVRSFVPPENTPRWGLSTATSPTLLVEDGEVRLRTHLAAMYTPPSRIPAEWHAELKTGADGTARPPGQGLAYRNRHVPVPEDRLQHWTEAKFARVGIVGIFHVELASTIRVRGENTQVARVTVSTLASEHLRELLRVGIGRKRSFGLGMVLVDPM